MKKKQKKIIIPSYYKEFKCIGTKCESNCCEAGWYINIDKNTYAKYKKVKDNELKNKLNEYIVKNKNNLSDRNYGNIQLCSGGICPFLNKEKLCEIQSKYGEEYLGLTCVTYPRVCYEIDDVMIKSMTISCPEAARLVLLNSDGISFQEELEIADSRNDIVSKINTLNKNSTYLEKEYWDILFFIVQMLKSPDYEIWERMYIVGRLLQNLECNEKECNELINTHVNLAESGILKEVLINVEANFTFQMELLKEIADERYFGGNLNKKYRECYAEFLSGIGYILDTDVEEIGERYKYAYNNFFTPFFNDKQYILENYLVNYVLKNNFPFGPTKNIYDNYMSFVVQYCIIKMMLIGMAAYHKDKFDINVVIKCFESCTMMFEHNSNFIEKVINLLKENGYTDLKYMVVLLKN